jgi:hypothetical protein
MQVFIVGAVGKEDSLTRSIRVHYPDRRTTRFVVDGKRNPVSVRGPWGTGLIASSLRGSACYLSEWRDVGNRKARL